MDKEPFGPDSTLIGQVADYLKSQCVACKHKWPGEGRCNAFAEGIPVPILLNAVDHREEFSGDLGVRWEPVEPGMEWKFESMV